METLKNFFVGFFVTLLALVALALSFILWPFILGIGSFVLFVGVIVLFVILGFYIIVLIGHTVRKGFKKQE
ncbi:MAG: hypothetical protein ISS92_01285 [Candidatus Omnitrophica bacterium]|nr:hypothetical protein [Candidatus Omnitrophota bacterium]